MSGSYNHEVFANLLTDAMERRGLSQRAVSIELGVSQQLVSKWTKGTSRPKPATILDLAGLLDLDALDLLRAVGYVPVGAPEAPGITRVFGSSDDAVEALTRQIETLMNRVQELEQIVQAVQSEDE